MRGILFAVAMAAMTSGASASSFVVLGEAKAPEPIGNTGSSIIALGAAAAPVAITSTDMVDPTETASTGITFIDPRVDDAPRAKSRAAVVAAEWARLSSTPSRSMLFYGTPDPDQFKTPEEKTASLDPTAAPMVMRGGIEGGLFAEKPKAEAKDEAATEVSKDASKPTEAVPQPDAPVEAKGRMKPGDHTAAPKTAEIAPEPDAPAKAPE